MDRSVNGYIVHVYEENGKGFCGHADHSNGRQVYRQSDPVSLRTILGHIETAIVADALRERKQ